MLLLCLHGNSAVCVSDLSYQKLKHKIQRYFGLNTVKPRIRLGFPKSKILIVLV